jgi:ATP-dependent DNA helicase RecG
MKIAGLPEPEFKLEEGETFTVILHRRRTKENELKKEVERGILAELLRLHNETQHTQPFDHSICYDASFNDLDLEKITEFLKQDRVQQEESFHPSVSIQDQLLQFGLIQKSSPTYGALLCFGKNPPKWLPGAFTRCTVWRGNDRHIGWLDSQEFRGDLLRQLDGSLGYLRKHLHLSRVLRTDGSTEQWEIPFVALEEALANALVHREYANRTDYVHIEVFDDRIEISSPGDLPPPMTLDLLGIENRSYPRNPQIAQVFYLSGYIEEVGSGIQRMQYLLKEARLPAPEFRLSAAKTLTVVIFRPNLASNDFVSAP